MSRMAAPPKSRRNLTLATRSTEGGANKANEMADVYWRF